MRHTIKASLLLLAIGTLSSCGKSGGGKKDIAQPPIGPGSSSAGPDGSLDAEANRARCKAVLDALDQKVSGEQGTKRVLTIEAEDGSLGFPTISCSI